MSDAILKYISRDSASTVVVIKGLAMTAGSKPILLARMGIEHPTSFARTIVARSVRDTTSAISIDTLSK